MHTSIHNLRYYIAAAGLLLVATVSGDPPAWWSEGDPPVIDTSATPNNKGPANVGQAKWMAHSAIEALRTNHSGIASEIELLLVGEDKIIKTLAPPANDADREKNHAPLLVGQLKNIATPFYDALHIADPIWLETQLTDNQTKDPIDPTNYYPWSKTPADDQNRAIATIGQLKAVFSLRFETLDADHDGLADAWEASEIRFLVESDPIKWGNLDGSSNLNPVLSYWDDGYNAKDSFKLGFSKNKRKLSDVRDSDGDDVTDANDAAPLDSAIDWQRSSTPKFAAVKISDLATMPTSVTLSMRDFNNHANILAVGVPVGPAFSQGYVLENGHWNVLPGTISNSFQRSHKGFTFTYKHEGGFDGWQKIDDNGAAYGLIAMYRTGDPDDKDSEFWEGAPPADFIKIVKASPPNYTTEILGFADEYNYTHLMNAGGNGVVTASIAGSLMAGSATQSPLP